MSTKNNEQKKGSFIGLVPLLVFLAIYFLMGVGSGSFDNFPLMIGMFVAMVVSFMIKKPGEKLTFGQKVDMFCEGGGDKTLILVVIIYMLAGGFYGVAGAMHATTSVTNLMLSILPARAILPGLFLIGCVLSFAMGTSMGTVTALLPIGLEIGKATGVSIPLICGIVVGGAMFGDNLSFISDTTIAATTTQGVGMKEKFKANILMVLPAVIINCIILAFWPINAESFNMGGAWSFVNLIPYIMIIALSLAGVNVVPAMGLSIVAGVIIGIAHGDFTFVQCFNVIHDGMTGMEDMAVITIFVGGVIAFMKYLGGIDWLLNTIGKHSKGRVGAELSIALLVTLVDIATTNNTLSIIACGPIAKDISEKFGISPARTASILDLFSSAGNGITPYAGQLLVAGGLASIPPVTIMPYVFYSWLMFVFGIIFILIGFPKGVVNGKKKTEDKTAA
ncbi:MAG: Na+/H+ antiporter NhaC family protein [Solobacterium sp.]|nr:Na+/H+ antiporter NhaC family protein [Solobacterium sp.]MCH4048626.1 Na+/H+ antiporter NhaC family protein [Solobacterium sp.]MCH4075683.1 Na+/H+ antiporter NhaC family protein [Solobacterium sp.]